MTINKSFIRYVVVGGSAFILEYLGYLALHQVIGLSYQLSSVIVYSVLFWFVFLLNRQWSFESTGSVYIQLVKYIALFIFNNLVGNILLMQFLVDGIGISALIAPVLKMAMIVIWNYFIYKYFIYK